MVNALSLGMQKTRHAETCTLRFGKPSAHDDCPRCNELKAGAAPRRSWGSKARDVEAAQLRAIRAHVHGPSCGPVCTFGDW